jgi:2-oxoglutarate dehydrogenase E2 component (dihydrolipoamide succinyltransferase)
MSTEIRVPQLPESVADATLVAWHKQPGESIARDENLADLETDKVVLEVPAPTSGVVREIKVQSGTVVRSGQLLAIIEESAAAAAPTARPAAAAKAAAVPSVVKEEREGAKESGKLSPSVRRLIEENQLDPASIPASGKDGRLTKSDVVGFLDKKAVANAAPVPVPPAPLAARADHHVPMTRLRQRIAQRLIEAQSTQALLTTFNEVDLGAIQELRARYKERFEKEHGVKLGFMSFFVKACIEALKKYPIINAAVDGQDIVYHEYYDIGVAVSTERGLMVPIVRDADAKGFAAIEKEIADYARMAREGSIAIEDLTGGTFTITNGGVFGSLMSTPIVNAPQSAILGMHKIQERPMVVDGQIAIRPMMYLAVTYDHRLIDGREAVLFLVAVKEALEDPGRMLLGI